MLAANIGLAAGHHCSPLHVQVTRVTLAWFVGPQTHAGSPAMLEPTVRQPVSLMFLLSVTAYEVEDMSGHVVLIC